MDNIAIIDLGTNTFHLLIINKENGAVLTKFKYPVKIGEGGISNGIIITSAELRAIEALTFFKEVMVEYHTTSHFAFATSAFRNAKNGKEIVEKIQKILDININIIDGQREAELIYKGVIQAVKPSENTLIVDIGGGSVEFVICNKEKILWSQSFEIGAQRLLDMFHNTDPISMEEVERLYIYLDTELDVLYQAAKEHNVHAMIGSAGTFDTIIEIHYRELDKPIRTTEKAFKLPLDAYYKAHELLVTNDKEGRLKIPGMVEMRVDMIVVASCLIYHLIKKLNINKIDVSSYSLKEGVLSELNIM